MRIAVTGNIGCGKSTACNWLKTALPTYIHASVDAEVHALYDDREFKHALRGMFATDSRTEISDLVFADPIKRQQLELLTKDAIGARLERLLLNPRVVLEFPLLYEIPGWVPRFDYVLALGCDEETQRQRVLARDDISVEKFDKIRQSQLSRQTKAALADDYVDTGAGVEDTRAQLESLLPKIQHRALKARCESDFSPATWTRMLGLWEAGAYVCPGIEVLQNLMDAYDRRAEVSHGVAIRLALWFSAVLAADDARISSSVPPRQLAQVIRDQAPKWLSGKDALEVALASELLLSCAQTPTAYVQASPTRLAAYSWLQSTLQQYLTGMKPTRIALPG